jgi:DNA-binding GntR family transcriptional regulator
LSDNPTDRVDQGGDTLENKAVRSSSAPAPDEGGDGDAGPGGRRPAARRPPSGGLDGIAIDRSSTADRVVEALRTSLFDGRLRPGTPLREVELAAALGVSRSTVREALRTLVAEHLLTREPNRGVVVRTLDGADVEDLFRARHVLEAGAIGAARPEQVDRLARALADYERSVAAGDGVGTNAAHIAFHEALIGLAGSERLSALGAALLGDLRLALATVEREADDAADQLARHRRLYRLIATGDTPAALADLADHLHHAAEPLAAALPATSGRRRRAKPTPTQR